MRIEREQQGVGELGIFVVDLVPQPGIEEGDRLDQRPICGSSSESFETRRREAILG